MAAKKNKKAISTKTIFVILLMVLTIGILSFSLAYAATSKSTKTITRSTSGPTFGIYINPAKTVIQKGDKFSVDVKANLSTYPVQAISVFLRYDPSLLKLESIDQSKVNPSYSLKTACSSTNGCKKAGEAILIIGYVGNGVIQPKNGILVGSLKLTALKQGNTSIKIEDNTKLSGFTSNSSSKTLLDSRMVQNSYVNIVKSVVK